MRIVTFLLLGAGLLTAADAKEDAARELKSLEGKWRFVAITSEGKDAAESVVKAARLTIAGKRFTLQINTETHTGIINLNPYANPKTIDITYNSGPERGKKALGIYETERGKLKVCMGVVGAARPTKFVSTPRSGHVLEVLQREKP